VIDPWTRVHAFYHVYLTKRPTCTLERLHRSTVTVTITIKSGSHKGMNQYFMVTVEKASPTGATITITFTVMVTAAINLGSLWRDFT
jgi:hypothetical protein